MQSERAKRTTDDTDEGRSSSKAFQHSIRAHERRQISTQPTWQVQKLAATQPSLLAYVI